MPKKLLALVAGMCLLAACGTAKKDMAETATMDTKDRSVSSESTMAAPTPGTAEELMQVIGDRVYFGFDQYNLTDESQRQVAKWADWLGTHQGLKVVVEGHADERGTREYNLALGDRRAAEVRNQLLSLGVDGSRVETISYGKERPVDPASNPTAWAKNRRGVMVLN